MSINRIIGKLFDCSWYETESGESFSSKEAALQHYLSIGEKKGFFPNPIFDPVYYKKVYKIEEDVSALNDFSEAGIRECRNPNAYFLSEWYVWQNPAATSYMHPMFHYLKVGRQGSIDPAPWVDMEVVKRNLTDVDDGVLLLNAVIKGVYSSKEGICDSQKQLATFQKRFIDNIEFNLAREPISETQRKYLVWVQCRPGAEFFNWYRHGERSWDLLLNYYDAKGGASDVGDYVVIQNGTKFTAIFNVWRYTNILEKYDYILFLDDDLEFKYKTIDKYFKFIDKYSLDLSQPCLSAGSYCVWPVLFKKKFRGYRETNGVEIMMPAFSRRAFNLMAPYFGSSVSGFGLDLLFAKLAKDNSFKVGVVDSIVAKHNSVIDQSGGAYYELLRSCGINSKYELWSLINRFDLEREFYELH